jgi:hypothetical protein
VVRIPGSIIGIGNLKKMEFSGVIFKSYYVEINLGRSLIFEYGKVFKKGKKSKLVEQGVITPSFHA